MYMSELKQSVVSELFEPVVQVKYGKIRGIKKNNSFIFRGIPYAKAIRFHIAEEPDPWDGILEALAYGPSCPLFTTDFGKDQLVDPHFYMPQSENCLNLNIWTPSLSDGKKRDVLVWFHGGGWKDGSAFEQFSYDGEELSNFGDIVVVSVNHRLNCFGYLDLSSFGEPYLQSGVAGITDLIAALRWVHDNIEAFGGDPGKVTIAGQSGGSGKVCSMLQSPQADGLYKGIIADGNWNNRLTDSNGYTVNEYTKRMGELVVQRLGLTDKTIWEIEAVPYYDLIDACLEAGEDLYKETGIRYKFEPVPGTEIWPGHPFDVGMRKETIEIPMLLGGCFGDHSSNVEHNIGTGGKDSWSDAYVRLLMQQEFGDQAGAIEKEFRKVWPSRPLADVLFVDKVSRMTVFRFMKQRLDSGGKNLWNCRFDFESPLSGGLVAWHCSELHFFFHNACYNEASYIPGVTERLQDQMAAAWIAFIKTGNPNHPGIPSWPEVTLEHVSTMLFDRETVLRTDHDGRLSALVQKR